MAEKRIKICSKTDPFESFKNRSKTATKADFEIRLSDMELNLNKQINLKLDFFNYG